MCDTTLTRPLFSFLSLELSDWRWLRVWTVSHVRLQWMTICYKWSLYLVSQLLRDLYHLEKEKYVESINVK